MRIFKNYILFLLISNCIRVLHIKGTKKDVCIAHVTLEADEFQDLQGESASKDSGEPVFQWSWKAGKVSSQLGGLWEGGILLYSGEGQPFCSIG